MANTWYGAGISLNQTIGFTSPAPLDSRVTVKTIADLDTIDNPYIGLMTYVIDELSYYIYTEANEWSLLKTGLYNVSTVAELSNLSSDKELSNGTMVYVDEVNLHFSYDSSTNKWNPLYTGLPIYDAETINKLGPALTEKDYIYIGNKHSDIYLGEVVNRTITTQNDGNYVNILFSAMRELQSEIAKIKNTFNYGLYSYTGTHTAISSVMDSYSSLDASVEAEEPLWSIEESDLSPVSNATITIGKGCELVSKTGSNLGINTDTDGVVKLETEGVHWTDTAAVLETLPDVKLFLFLSVSDKDVSIKLKNLDYVAIDGEEQGNDQYYSIDVNSIDINSSNVYNLQMCISRMQLVESTTGGDDGFVGKNYIWMSISNINSETLAEGYWNPSTNLIQEEVCVLPYRYSIYEVVFGVLNLTKMNFYTKYQDFSHEVIPSKPEDIDYRYKVSHITIRSVSTYEVLRSVAPYLPNNELIFEETNKKLWIKNNNSLIALSGSGGSINPDVDPSAGDNDDTMEISELIVMLKDLGIVYDASTGIELSPVSSITFIHEGTGKKFEYQTNAYGSLVGVEKPNEDTSARLAKAIERTSGSLSESYLDTHGFVGLLRRMEYKVDTGNNLSMKADGKLYTDRIRIGAWYAPLNTDVVYGCTHGYIELENTSDKDFDLTGSYLHYMYSTYAGESETSDGILELKTEHLALSGVIKGGSTYLIRCKRYAEDFDTNAFIKVSSFDLEWYTSNGKLLDMTVNTSKFIGTSNFKYAYGIALTYGQPNLTPETRLYENHSAKASEAAVVALGLTVTGTTDPDTTTYPLLMYNYTIDAVCYNAVYGLVDGVGAVGGANPCWATAAFKTYSNSILKNTFELDPAKLAFQAFSVKESSRARWSKEGTDVQHVSLATETIRFPQSELEFPVNNYTPKASFENKNVCTDKTKLDENRPNMVTCSFGTNIYTTRCFNWISVGLFDEYIWLVKDPNSTIYNSWNDEYKQTINFKSWTKMASYKSISSAIAESSTYPHRKEWQSVELNNAAYARISNRFPGGKVFYTSHKCVVKLQDAETAAALSSPQDWVYVVARADKNGNPDFNYMSEAFKFTVYPNTYVPQVYLTTDQQGFHWIEYQVWSAAAKKLDDKIKFDMTHVIKTKTIDAADVINTGSVGAPVYKINTASSGILSSGETFNSITSNRTTSQNITVTFYYKGEGKMTGTDGQAYTNGQQITMRGAMSGASNTYIPLTNFKNNGTEGTPDFVLNTTAYTNFYPVGTPIYKYTYTLGEGDSAETTTVRFSQSELSSINDALPEGITKIAEDLSNATLESTASITCNYDNTDEETVTYTLSYYSEESNNIIPILLNSGDMTQNGTRINEWYDYYEGGHQSLFKHLEQNNVVGNNDLCNTDVTALGTGDDEGKSNSYFFHLFYCYDVDESSSLIPMCNGKYIPALYYFDTTNQRFLMVNSEITAVNCKKWYNLGTTVTENGTDVARTVNIYTGWTIDAGTLAKYYTDIDGFDDSKFTPIYDMLYGCLIDARTKKLTVIPTCHEMPFTVITNGSIKHGQRATDRSINTNGTSLIGSHMNQMTAADTIGIYWFSRLLEYFDVPVCLGGHKHTYAITYPIRELFYWRTNDVLYNSKDNYGLYAPESTLANDDNLIWKVTTADKLVTKNLGVYFDTSVGTDTYPDVRYTDNIYVDAALTKMPLAYVPWLKAKHMPNYVQAPENITTAYLQGIAKSTFITADNTYFYPYTPVMYSSENDLRHAVTYFMCQATGYKLTSNKELPSANQKFGRLIPKTTIKNGNDTAAADQKYPMFGIVKFGTSGRIIAELIRIDKLMVSGAFALDKKDNGPAVFQYFKERSTDYIIESEYNSYGHWVSYEETLFNVKDFTPKS